MSMDFNPYPVGLRPGYSNTAGQENIVGEDQATPTATSLLGRLKAIADNILTVLRVQGAAANGAAVSGNPVLVGGSDGTNARSLSVDALGRLVTAPQSALASVSGFAAGFVATAATARVAVRSTVYTEQAADAQRSVVSTSANDSAGGTGVRSVRITYLSLNTLAFKTVDVTLNGTTPVNTGVSDICYIEKFEALTVGSGGVAAGTINLKAATAGGGATIWSIATGTTKAFSAHHYVLTGQTCRVTGMYVSHNGTVVGSGAVFNLYSLPIGLANAVEQQITDFIRLYGQSSGVPRTFGTPIAITGPARLTLNVTPESGSALVYRGSFDFYDQGTT